MKKSRSKKKPDVSESLLETEKEEGNPTLVPKLRFPEFVGGKFRITSLGEVTAECTGRRGMKPISAAIMGVSKADGIVPMEERIIGKDTTRYKLLSPNCFAYNPMRINIGSIARWKGDCDVLVSPDYIVFRCIDDHETGISADYLDQFRGSLQWEKFVSGSGDGGVRIRIYYKDLALLSMGLPSLPEQRKIASCLASLDELIGEQGRKVDALRTHKKGLMQKLFPREGETQPQLRFPEFQDEDHWKYITLGDIAEIKLGKMLDKQKNKAGHLLPYLNNISVRWNEVNTTDLPQMYFDDTELDRFGLMAGDVVVCEGGEPGRAAVWDGRLPNVKFQKAIHRVRFTVPFEPKLFVLHLENLAGTNQFEMLFTGGGIKHLTRETFSQLRVPLISIREQQRIATCLSSLDDLITAETQKLEALKTHKRGLMQQMFPSQEEA